MPKPSKQQVSLDATPWYHCVSHCGDRAFLCGTDQSSGNCDEHRRCWLEERILVLPEISSTFAGREDKVRNARSILGYRRPPAIQQSQAIAG
jgi:hypothetical protein